MENAQTRNRYIYVLNNPLKYIDPSGLSQQNVYPDWSWWFEKELQEADRKWQNDWEKFTEAVNDIVIEAAKFIIFDWDNPSPLEFVGLVNKPGKACVKVVKPASKAIMEALEKAVKGAGKVQAPQKVIGHYPEYVEMSNKLGTKPFSIPDNIWSKMNPSEQWSANQKFLDRAIAEGSEFNLATPIDKVRPDSFLQKEINYLMSQGYKLSSDGTKLVK